MLASYHELTDEIRRVVECPYPTQLQTLQSLLKSATTADFERWSIRYPHQIQPLVREIVNALPQWPYCLEIISALASVPQVRNAFLYQDVSLLPQIATAAVIDFGSDSANVRAAILLLSDELPADIPLPADVQILISKLFARAVSFPTLANVMTVDRLLSGGCRPVLAVLPHETLKRFEAQIFTILKDATDVEQQTVGLHCLSIMASFVRVRASRDRNSSTGAAVMSFFAGSKAAKTMQLTALQVVWACGSAGAEVPLQAVECLRAAVNAISAIDVPLRHEWCSKNARILQKLVEKVTAAIPDPSICLEALSFVATLMPPEHMPNALLETLTKMLCSITTVNLPMSHLEQTLRICCAAMLSHISPKSLVSIIGRGIAISTSAGSDSMSRSRLLILIRVITEQASLVSPQAFQNMAIDNFSVLKGLRADKDEAPRDRQSSDSVSDIKRYIAQLVLKLALAASPSEGKMPESLTEELIELLSRASPVHDRGLGSESSRGMPMQNSGNSFTLPSQSSESWQDGLALAVHRHADLKIEAIEKYIRQICHDLEKRCETVEAPLREAQAVSANLEQKNSGLEQAYHELQSELMSRDLQIADLEAQSKVDSDEASAEREDLIARLERAEDILRETQAEMQRELSSLRNRQGQASIDNASVVARLEDDLDTEKDLRQEAEDRLAEAENQLEGRKQEASALRVKIESMQSKILGLEGDIQQGQQHLLRMTEATEAGSHREMALQQELQAARSKLEGSGRTIGELEQKLQDECENWQRQKDDFMREYQENATHARDEWNHEKAELRDKLRDSEEQRNRDAESHKEETSGYDARHRELKKKVEKLKRENAQKAAQVEEAQEMRNRLMSAMGMAVHVAATEPVQSTLPIRSLSSAATPRTQLDMTPRQEEPETDQLDGSFGSATSSFHEPTPKRTKPRRAFKVPTLHQPKEASGRRSVRPVNRTSIMGAGRFPLLETSANQSPSRRSPSKVMFKEPSVVLSPRRGEDLRVLEGWSFSTDMPTSTAMPGLSGVGGDRLDDFDPDETVDI